MKRFAFVGLFAATVAAPEWSRPFIAAAWWWWMAWTVNDLVQ